MQTKPILHEVVFSHSLIISRIEEYARFLNQFYAQKKLCIIIVLNGAAFFAVHLISNLTMEIEIDFIAVSSYRFNSKKETKFYKELKINVTNRHLLVVEDIVDSGQTFQIVRRFAQDLKPQSIRFCSLVKGFKIKESFLSLPIDFLLTLKQDI